VEEATPSASETDGGARPRLAGGRVATDVERLRRAGVTVQTPQSLPRSATARSGVASDAERLRRAGEAAAAGAASSFDANAREAVGETPGTDKNSDDQDVESRVYPRKVLLAQRPAPASQRYLYSVSAVQQSADSSANSGPRHTSESKECPKVKEAMSNAVTPSRCWYFDTDTLEDGDKAETSKETLAAGKVTPRYTWAATQASDPDAGEPRGVVAPLFIGLNLERHREVFAQAAVAFAAQLSAHFHVDLPIPGFAASLTEATVEPTAQGTALPEAQPSARTEDWKSKFRWPHALHMTTFYLGGAAGSAKDLQDSLQRALSLEGTEWLVRSRAPCVCGGCVVDRHIELGDRGLANGA